MTEKCLLCGAPASKMPVYGNKGVVFECKECGSYLIPDWITPGLLVRGLDDESKFLIACHLRHARTLHEKNPVITLFGERIERILNYEVPKNVQDKVDGLMEYVNNRSSFFGSLVLIDKYASYSWKEAEFQRIVHELSERGLLEILETGNEKRATLTMKGVEFINQRGITVREDKCFVAMWFNEELNRVYEKCIVPACHEAGYEPVRVDRENYNGDITDRIISRIRTTAFTIADMSGYRGGVYYEAGFARGLGKEVILTCMEEWFDGNPKENKKVHFDINHLNIIVWKPNELELFKADLADRIVATMGKGSFVMQN